MEGADKKPEINDAIGCCYMGVQNYDEALNFLNKAIEYAP